MPESTQNSSKNNNVLITVLVIAVLAAASYGVYRSSNKPSEVVTANQNGAPVGVNEETPGTVSDASYKDGDYTMVGNYNSPGGPETISVQLTLKDNVITAATVQPQAVLPASKNFQGMFRENFTPMVVGKRIDEVSLTKVSGSSLTPKGFNDAVEKIKAQAQA